MMLGIDITLMPDRVKILKSCLADLYHHNTTILRATGKTKRKNIVFPKVWLALIHEGASTCFCVRCRDT